MSDLPQMPARIKAFSELLSDEERRGCVIFASTAIILHGVDLGRNSDDLDVFTSKKIYGQLKARFSDEAKLVENGSSVDRIVPLPNVEVFATFPGVTYDEVIKRAKPLEGTFGLPVASLEDLRTWKTVQGRDKDKQDLSRMADHALKLSPQLSRHILSNLPALLIRDALLDLFTETEKSAATLISEGQAVADQPCFVYTGKLFCIDKQLYSATGVEGIRKIPARSTEVLAVTPLGLPTTDRLCQRNSVITLNTNDIVNYQGKESLETTTGRLLLNYVILVDPFGDLIPYVNSEWKIGSIEETLVDLLFTGRLTVEQIKHYSRNLHWLGHFTELAVPSFTERALTVDPAIIARRNELLEQHRDAIEAGDAVVMSQIESELVAMDRASIKGDVSTLFYDRDGKSYDVHRKSTLILGGMVQNFGDKGYGFIGNSLEEGWDVEKFPTICNEIRRGSFARAKETAKGGEETKFVIRVFQNTRIVEEDCHSKRCLHVHLTGDMVKKYLYRNIVVDDTLIQLSAENSDNYVGQTVLMRSPLYCDTKNGYCFACMGGLFKSINQELITMIAVQVTSAFTKAALKSKHVTQARRIEVTSLNQFVV